MICSVRVSHEVGTRGAAYHALCKLSPLGPVEPIDDGTIRAVLFGLETFTDEPSPIDEIDGLTTLLPFLLFFTILSIT